MERFTVETNIEAKSEADVVLSSLQKPIGIDLFHSVFEVSLHPRLLEDVRLRNTLAEKLSDGRPNDEVYGDLTKFILLDSNNSRIILYLPFGLIPNIKNGDTTTIEQNFAKTLHDGWIQLLFESEVRASFNDGDELEPGLGEPERTRKAAHLLPEFLKKGIVTEEEIINMLTISDEDQLLQSLTEGVVVARDKNLFDDLYWDKIYQLSKNKNGIAFVLGGINAIKTTEHRLANIDETLNLLNSELIDIDKKFAFGSVHSKSVSEKRVKWEKWVAERKAHDKAATAISAKIVVSEIPIRDIYKISNRTIGVLSIQKAEEVLAKTDAKHAIEIGKTSQKYITDIWLTGTKEEKDAVLNYVSHLKKLGILPNHLDEKLGIWVPDLANPFPIDLNDFASNEGKVIFDITKKIESDPNLSKLIYPFVLTFGSRVKGYSDKNGDIDMAIFVKPQTTWEKREKLLSQLQSSVPEIKNVDRLLEFWVSENNGDLGLKAIPQKAPNTIVGPAQIHFLFGGIWIGQGEDLQKLRESLTKKYLDLSRFGDQKDMVRTRLLRQIELDVLQYRLMHKGFRKFYPLEKETGTQNSDLIDWESDFWDEGYRKIATQLFLKKVFLPDLS